MFEKVGVQEIFATPVWIVDLKPDHADALNRDLLAAIEALILPLPSGMSLGQTNWQTDPNLQDLPQFTDFISLVEKAAHAAAEYLKLRSTDLTVTGCWANINPPGAHNPPHIHPNNYLSGVYYVATPPGEGRITFEDPRAQTQIMMPPVTEPTLNNGNLVNFGVKAGRLLMFPAWLAHSVPVNRSQMNRVSISFNLMFRNFIRDASPAMWKGSAQNNPSKG